jgi:hypothetical protein
MVESAMKSKGTWKVRNRSQLLLALMQELEGTVHVSFEGDLGTPDLPDLSGASFEPTSTLKRTTPWPKQGFRVLPLESGSGKPIHAALSETVPKTVLHIQIEKNGTLQFGAYDNHPECIFFGGEIRQELLDSLAPRVPNHIRKGGEPGLLASLSIPLSGNSD